MKKIVSFLILTLNIPLLAPPKGFKAVSKKIETLDEVLQDAGSVISHPETLPASAKSSTQFLAERPHSQVNDDDDTSGFDATDDLSHTRAIASQPVQTWMTVLYESYHKAMHEKCLFQRFCQTIGAKTKYNVLLDLHHKGQLTNYIDELNRTRVSTGDSLLNEAFCEAIQDKKKEDLIKLLSETLDYSDKLSSETKQRIDIFLQQDNIETFQDISKKVSDYLERVRLVTQIRNTLAGRQYEGPNLLAMTSAAYARINELTGEVVTNNLKSAEQEEAK